jgi:hypothetical protein
MKQQHGRTQPMLFNPFTLWTDLALKTGEIMLASAQAVERKARSGDLSESAASLTRRTAAITRDILAPNNGGQRRKAKANGTAKRSGKRRAKK